MAFSLIGSAVSGQDDITPVTTATYDTTGADLLVVIVSHNSSAGGTPTLSDSKGNTNWQALTNYNSGASAKNIRIYYHTAPVVGSGHTVTFATGATFAFASVWFTAWSGSHASPFDVENGASTGAATSITVGSVTPSQNDSLLITGVTYYHASVTATISGGGFSSVEGVTGHDPAGAERGGWDYVIQTTAAASNPTWDFGGNSVACAAAIAVFKPAAGGGGGEPTLSWMPVSRVVQGQAWKAVSSGMTPSSDPD